MIDGTGSGGVGMIIGVICLLLLTTATTTTEGGWFRQSSSSSADLETYQADTTTTVEDYLAYGDLNNNNNYNNNIPIVEQSLSVISESSSTSSPSPPPLSSSACPVGTFQCIISFELENNKKINSLYNNNNNINDINNNLDHQHQVSNDDNYYHFDGNHRLHHYKLIESSSSPSSSSQPNNYICISTSQVCDGITDCPGGEDEQHDICDQTTITTTTTPTTVGPKLDQSPSPDQDQEEGCYLCKGLRRHTHHNHQCIPLVSLCDGKRDCPLGDDEFGRLCVMKKKNNSITTTSSSDGSTGTGIEGNNATSISNFTSPQYGISIVNTVESSDFSEQQQPAKPMDIMKNTKSPIWDTTTITNHQHRHQADPSSQGVHNGVGFMFRVDNLIINNSQVKMFNQNSENLASKQMDDNGSNGDHGERYPGEQQQQQNHH